MWELIMLELALLLVIVILLLAILAKLSLDHRELMDLLRCSHCDEEEKEGGG